MTSNGTRNHLFDYFLFFFSLSLEEYSKTEIKIAAKFVRVAVPNTLFTPFLSVSLIANINVFARELALYSTGKVIS